MQCCLNHNSKQNKDTNNIKSAVKLFYVIYKLSYPKVTITESIIVQVEYFGDIAW